MSSKPSSELNLELRTAEFRGRYLQTLQNNYPDLPTDFANLVAPQLVSPLTLFLPARVREQVERLARLVFKIKQSASYSEQILSEQNPELRSLLPIRNHAICNSFDIHLDAQNELHLIEINTNAAFYLAAVALYEAQSLPAPFFAEPRAELLKGLQSEYFLVRQNEAPLRKIAILDEAPEKQKLFLEFLMFQSFVRQQGIECAILDAGAGLSADQLAQFDLIYNRWTDFVLASPEAQILRELYLNHKFALTPHPREYLLLADKLRLNDLRSPAVAEAAGLTAEEARFLASSIPAATVLSETNREEVWARRKQLFFKPAQSFGSKQAFKGANISRKAFDGYFQNTEPMLGQEIWPAPELVIPGEGERKFKYDLRFYFYRDQVQFGVARLYEGQTTNLRALGGGFAALQWQDNDEAKPFLK